MASESKTSKRKSNDCYSPSKQSCVEFLNDENLCSTSKDLASEDLPLTSNDVNCEAFNDLLASIFKDSSDQTASVVNQTIFEKDLTSLLFLTVEFHNSILKVYFKQFKRDGSYNMIPTKHEVSMTILTWFDFFKKMNDFDLVYPSSSYIANNKIMVLNLRSEVYISTIKSTKTSHVVLKVNQFELLRQCISEINDSVLRFMFHTYLPRLIIQEQRCVLKFWKSEASMMCHLIIWIEHDLTRIFRTLFQCNGCKKAEANPLNHECFNLTNCEKYQRLGYEILMLTNIPKIVKNFLSHIDFVTENFLNTLDVYSFCQLLFKTV